MDEPPSMAAQERKTPAPATKKKQESSSDNSGESDCEDEGVTFSSTVVVFGMPKTSHSVTTEG
ncbi:hypothetical protein MKW92_031296 [Papaver armeniacum]|nr:hypothetical protein MKW92_031296 [Papaver armeniacum]